MHTKSNRIKLTHMNDDDILCNLYIDAIAALVLLSVSVKHFKGLDFSYFLEMLRGKKKIGK